MIRKLFSDFWEVSTEYVHLSGLVLNTLGNVGR